MKVAVISSHWASLPLLQVLSQKQVLAGLCVPDRVNDATIRLQQAGAMLNIPVETATQHTLTDTLPAWLTAIETDAVFVLGFPFKLPDSVLTTPRLGIYNFHFGKLPDYRGPDPKFWQIRKQEKAGTVTVHRMTERFDDGPIVAELDVPIAVQDTYGLHLTNLAYHTIQVTESMVEQLEKANAPLQGVAQDQSKASYQSKPSAQDLTINWEKDTVASIDALVRASNPVYGGAVTYLRGMPVRILEAEPVEASSAWQPGVTSVIDNQLYVGGVNNEAIKLSIISVEQGVYSSARFANLFRIESGEQLTSAPPSQSDTPNANRP